MLAVIIYAWGEAGIHAIGDQLNLLSYPGAIAKISCGAQTVCALAEHVSGRGIYCDSIDPARYTGLNSASHALGLRLECVDVHSRHSPPVAGCVGGIALLRYKCSI